MVNWLSICSSLLIISCIVVPKVSMASYCNVKTCSSNTHTMCKYKSSQYGPSCGNKMYIHSSLTDKEKQELLKIHNDLRYRVKTGKENRGRPGPQPLATNLRPLVWNNELAMVAQKWADQCEFRHDQCRDLEKLEVGQNIAYSSFSNDFPNNLTSIVLQWYDEVKDFNRNFVKNLPRQPGYVLHYTQMVWAGTKQVGCGLIKYKKQNYWYTTYLVCNYGPRGNMAGQPVYQTNEKDDLKPSRRVEPRRSYYRPTTARAPPRRFSTRNQFRNNYYYYYNW